MNQREPTVIYRAPPASVMDAITTTLPTLPPLTPRTWTALWIALLWVVACLAGGLAMGLSGCGGPHRTQDPEPAGCKDKDKACVDQPKPDTKPPGDLAPQPASVPAPSPSAQPSLDPEPINATPTL